MRRKKQKNKATKIGPDVVPKKKRAPSLRHWITNKLRRLSYQWPPRKDAIKAARLERGIYKCNICEGKFGPKEIQLDHIQPVIHEEDGFIDWNNYLNRLFCDESGFQVLCFACHSAKTFLENHIRQQVKQEKREQEEEIDV